MEYQEITVYPYQEPVEKKKKTTPESREKARARQKAWREANPEALARQNRRAYLRRKNKV